MSFPVTFSPSPSTLTSPQMSALKLPQELLDMAFDHLEPDKDYKRSLVACASVCHKWCLATRPRLFHTIKFTFRIDKPGRRWPTISSFLDFLDSEPGFSKIAPLIKKLLLTSSNPLSLSHNFRISAFELDRILLRLPAIRVLHLKGLTLSHSLSVVNGWSMPRSLDELRLKFVDFELCWPTLPSDQLEELVKPPAAACSLVQVLNLFRKVSYLYLDGIQVTQAHREHGPAVLATEGKKISRQLLLDRLYLYMDLSEYAAAFELLVSSHLLAHLNELDIGGPISMCNTVLRATGSSLSRLSLYLNEVHLQHDKKKRLEKMVSLSVYTDFTTGLTSYAPTLV